MKSSYHQSLVHAAIVVAALLPQALGAQSAAALPDARSLIAKHNTATNSETLNRVNSVTLKGRVSMAAMGLDAEIEILQAKPNKTAQKVIVAGVGEITSGFDGTTAWSVNPMQGPRVLEGKELENVKSESDFLQQLRGPTHVLSAETVEKTEMGGRPCFKVKLKWKSGREGTDCYDAETGLLVATVQTTDGPMGAVETTTILSDYKDFGGRKSPTKLVQSVMGQEQVVTITSVEYDKVPATAFEPPAAIKAMQKPSQP
jgi:hypothetical protein